MQKFFIDSGELTKISEIIDKLQQDLDFYGDTWGMKKRFAGITTNPKALAAHFTESFSLNDLHAYLTDLNSLLSRKRIDGIIYIQIPNDDKNPDNLRIMCDFVRSLDFKVGIKIPHYTYFLEESEKYADISFNVTGVSDYNIAAKALSHSSIDYVSIIPGRMEAADISYESGLSILRDNLCSLNNSKVIAGSMRTLSQLKTVLQYNCVPTIGATAFDNIFKDLSSNEDSGFFQLFDRNWCVLRDDYDEENSKGTELSKSFFDEMNKVNLLNIYG